MSLDYVRKNSISISKYSHLGSCDIVLSGQVIEHVRKTYYKYGRKYALSNTHHLMELMRMLEEV